MRDEDNDIIDSALETLAYQRKRIDAQALLIAELRAALEALGLEIRKKNDDQ